MNRQAYVFKCRRQAHGTGLHCRWDSVTAGESEADRRLFSGERKGCLLHIRLWLTVADKHLAGAVDWGRVLLPSTLISGTLNQSANLAPVRELSAIKVSASAAPYLFAHPVLKKSTSVWASSLQCHLTSTTCPFKHPFCSWLFLFFSSFYPLTFSFSICPEAWLEMQKRRRDLQTLAALHTHLPSEYTHTDYYYSLGGRQPLPMCIKYSLILLGKHLVSNQRKHTNRDWL